jgi:hypothetical protein
VEFFGCENDLIGSVVNNAFYERGTLEDNFIIEGEVIKTDGKRFFSVIHEFGIPAFEGVRRMDELNVQVMNPVIKKYPTVILSIAYKLCGYQIVDNYSTNMR